MQQATITAYIGLGSNLDDPQAQVCLAVEALRKVNNDVTVLAQSSWYCSRAIGPGNQPDYVNGAVAIHTTLSPEALLDLTQSIENKQGRRRELRWGARTLDLDILLYGDAVIETERLTIPHPEIKHRNFVVQPLLDLDKNLQLPDGVHLSQTLQDLGQNGLQKL